MPDSISRAPAASSPRRILCVDDDPILLRVLATLLFTMGFEVRTASSVAEALRIFHESPFTAVITDQEMPGQSGIDLLQRLRHGGSVVPVIFLTAFGTIDHAVRAVQTGANHYLTKPVDPVRLRSLLHELTAPASSERKIGGTIGAVAPMPQTIPAAVAPGAEIFVLPSLDVSTAERELIQRALERTRGNRTAAASLLGMHLRTLRRKLQALPAIASAPA